MDLRCAYKLWYMYYFDEKLVELDEALNEAIILITAVATRLK